MESGGLRLSPGQEAETSDSVIQLETKSNNARKPFTE